ncbi:hypothetical protein BS50DRAFT_510061, partial [Corynespora cassiicola Philippines]
SLLSLDDMLMTRRLNNDLAQISYQRFIYDFVVFESSHLPSGAVSDAIWEFLPTMYQRSAPGSCLTAIVEAVAFLNFANRYEVPEALILAEERLQKSIQLLRRRISTKRQASTDQTLCTVFLMGIYENLTLSGDSSSSMAHHQGIGALLQLRTPDQPGQSLVAQRLFEASCIQMLIGNMQAGRPPAFSICNTSTIGQHPSGIYGVPDAHLVRLLHNATSLHHRWLKLKHDFRSPPCCQKFQSLSKEALDMDADFQVWEGNLTIYWRSKVERNTRRTNSSTKHGHNDLLFSHRGAPKEIRTHVSLRVSWIKLIYQTARIVLLRNALEIMNCMLRLSRPTCHPTTGRKCGSSSHLATSSATIDITTLYARHAFSLRNLVDTIEKSCATILGHLSVIVPGESTGDVIGMRGYTLLWTLGVLDAVLSGGLVPQPSTSSRSNRAPPKTNQMHSTAPISSSKLLVDKKTNAFYDFSALPEHKPNISYNNFGVDGPKETSCSTSYQAVSASQDPVCVPFSASIPFHSQSIAILEKCLKGHVFNSAPRLQCDATEPLVVDFPITKPAHMYAPFRREWLNQMLVYIAREAGIKKALIVPLTEGFFGFREV